MSSDRVAEGLGRYVDVREFHPSYREKVCWNCGNRRLLGPNQIGRVCHECFMGQEKVDEERRGEYETPEGYTDYGKLWYGDVSMAEKHRQWEQTQQEASDLLTTDREVRV